MMSEGLCQLPEGWEIVRLGSVAEVKSGFSCAKRNLVPEDEGIAHLRPFNIDTRGQVDLSEVYHIPPDYKDNVEDYALEPGHVLFNNTNSVELVGKTALVREPLDCAFSNHIYRLTIKPKAEARLEPAWLALALRRLWSGGYFEERCNRWIGQAGFNSTMLKAVDIPLAPVGEQRRILARVDALFDRIEEARRLRDVAGREAEVLLPAVSGEVFETLERSEAIKFKDLVVDSRNGLYKPQSYYGSGVPIVRIDSFEGGEVRDYSELRRLQVTQEELEKFHLQSGDVLVNRVNGSLDELGKAAVVRGLTEPTVFESNIMRFRVDIERVIPEFVVTFLSSPLGRVQIRAKARTIQQFSINQGDVGSIVFQIPSLAEQRHVVEYLICVREQVEDLKQAQEAGEVELDRLEQSILARAFRGEL
jgi:type I restriction enzyme S subunit